MVPTKKKRNRVVIFAILISTSQLWKKEKNEKARRKISSNGKKVI